MSTYLITGTSPKYCGTCAKADDGGIVGNLFTCAKDHRDRPAHAECPYKRAFVMETRSAAERYPGYDSSIFEQGVARALRRVRDQIAAGEREAIGAGELTFAPTPGVKLTRQTE